MANDDRPLSDQSLQSELQAYQKALQEEWGATEENIKASEEDLAEKTRKMLLTGTPNAMGVIIHLAQHAASEQVQASCAKYVVDNALGKKGIAEPMTALDKLLQGADK